MRQSLNLKKPLSESAIKQLLQVDHIEIPDYVGLGLAEKRDLLGCVVKEIPEVSGLLHVKTALVYVKL